MQFDGYSMVLPFFAITILNIWNEHSLFIENNTICYIYLGTCIGFKIYAIDFVVINIPDLLYFVCIETDTGVSKLYFIV